VSPHPGWRPQGVPQPGASPAWRSSRARSLPVQGADQVQAGHHHGRPNERGAILHLSGRQVSLIAEWQLRFPELFRADQER
jgi:hypothetical protein